MNIHIDLLQNKVADITMSWGSILADNCSDAGSSDGGEELIHDVTIKSTEEVNGYMKVSGLVR